MDKERLLEYQEQLVGDIADVVKLRNCHLLAVSVVGITLSLVFVFVNGHDISQASKQWWLAAVSSWFASVVSLHCSFAAIRIRLKSVDQDVRSGQIDKAKKIIGRFSFAGLFSVVHTVLTYVGLIFLLMFVWSNLSERQIVVGDGNDSSMPDECSTNNATCAYASYEQVVALVADLDMLKSKVSDLANRDETKHIEYLKSRMDIVLFVFGVLAFLLSVWSASSIVKVKSFKDTIDQSSQQIRELESRISGITGTIDGFNITHMNYNARIFNSLAKTFEQVSDSLRLEGSSLSDVTLRARSAYLQTCILYYEQAVKYNLEAGTYDALFSAVHNLASLIGRIESSEFSRERHELKSRLLAKHEWLVTYDRIEESLKKSNHNVNEIATSLTNIRILFEKYGKK